MSQKVLIISSNHGSNPQCLEALESMDVEVDLAHNPVAAYPRLWRGGHGAIVAVLEPEPCWQKECLKVLWQARKNIPGIGILLMTDSCDEDLAQHAQELGVGFLLKRDVPREILEQALSSLGLASRQSKDAHPGANRDPSSKEKDDP